MNNYELTKTYNKTYTKNKIYIYLTSLIFFLVIRYSIYLFKEDIITNIQLLSSKNEVQQNICCTFDTISDLSAAINLKEGDIVTTNGYHEALDGGAASYRILKKSTYPLNDKRVITLDNGMFAELIIKDNTIIAEQFGAYGDGIHDDSAALQEIISLGYNLELSPKKNYRFINDGLYIDNSTLITGNGSQFTIDGSYNPGPQDMKYYFIRNRYGQKLHSFSANDLTINVNFPNGKYTGQSFVVISPLCIDNLSFTNININVSRTNNSVVCFWLNNGCNTFSLNKCNFYNRTSGTTGGTLWMTAKDDSLFNTFTAIKSAKITDSYFYGSAGDEVMSIWGTKNANVTFTNSTIEGDIIAQGTTRVISIFSQGDHNLTDNVTFNNCTIIGNCNKSQKKSYYDSLIGIGSDYPSNKINVYFRGGTINSNVYGSLLFPSIYNGNTVPLFDNNNKSVYVSFSGCDITSTSTITGSSPTYNNTSAVYQVNAMNCNFDDCNITCNSAFCFLNVPANNCFFAPEIVIKNSDIVINNSKSFVYKYRSNAPLKLVLINSHVTAPNISTMITSKNLAASNLRTQKNVVNALYYENSTLNGNAL